MSILPNVARASQPDAKPGPDVLAPAYWDDPSGLAAAHPNGALAACRLFCYGLLTVGLLPVQIVGLLCWPALANAIPRLHHRLCAWIIGLKIHAEGQPASGQPVLFISNHISYFDIIALGSILRASFIAKSDVAAWPVFGLLARLCRTVFVERRVAGARGHIACIRDRLKQADSLVVFPEGTSSDGSRVLPFKSTLFAAVEGEAITVQPISISYTRLNGMPIGRALRPLYAWYGDMDLGPHLWAALSYGSAEVVIRFHPPVIASEFANRKSLSQYCHDQIANGIDLRLTPSGQRREPLLDLPMASDSLQRISTRESEENACDKS